METKTYRMYLKTFRFLTRAIPPRKNETTADYFLRVAEHLEKLKRGTA